MDYYAGLDVSMEETHICIVDRDGGVVHETRVSLKSLATHKTDRNDARGLAHLARTGFFKPVHVKSL
jgi:hypothetical protein